MGIYYSTIKTRELSYDIVDDREALLINIHLYTKSTTVPDNVFAFISTTHPDEVILTSHTISALYRRCAFKSNVAPDIIAQLAYEIGNLHLLELHSITIRLHAGDYDSLYKMLK